MAESSPFGDRGLIGGIVLATACFVPLQASAQEGRRPDLVVAMEDLPAVFDSLDPVTAKASGYRVLYNIFDHLLDFDYAGDFSIIPAPRPTGGGPTTQPSSSISATTSSSTTVPS